MKTSLRIHHFLPVSRANGPGLRAVIWLQGCSLGCQGCFNPQTHAFQGGELLPVDVLFQRVLDMREIIQGVTISGGEPLQQPRPLLTLLQEIRQRTTLSVLLFSGYTRAEIERQNLGKRILEFLDVLVAGRYVQDQRLASGLLGSANQRLHLLSERYRLDDLQAAPSAEVLLTPEGEIKLSGIDPLAW